MGYFHIRVNIVVCSQASELRHLASEGLLGPTGICASGGSVEDCTYIYIYIVPVSS